MKVRNTNHVTDFRDLCPRTGLSWICHRLCRKHLHMLRWFVSATFMICVHDFPCREVLVKVGVMEFGLLRVGDISASFANDDGDVQMI